MEILLVIDAVVVDVAVVSDPILVDVAVVTDAVVVESLKETYLRTINGGFSSHPEDIAENLKVNAALKVVLGYFMFIGDAEEFFKEAESERKSD